MKLTFILAAGLMLGGCVPMVGIGAASTGGGFAAGWFMNPGNDIALLNAAMMADAPLKRAWCDDHAALPPAVAAYCAHIPTNINALPLVINSMIQADMTKARSRP